MKKIALLALCALALTACSVGDLPETPPKAVTDPASIELYQKALTGDMKSLKTLSTAFSKGTNGFPKDGSMYLRCLKMMGDRGDVVSQRQLGMAYLHGNGVMQSDSSANEWLTRAANQGDEMARRGLIILKAKSSEESARASARSYYNSQTRRDVYRQMFAPPTFL